MMKSIKMFFLIGSFLFSAHLLANDKEGFGIEDDVENLLHEIEEEKRQNEPQDEYSIYGEKGAYSEEERSPNNLSNQPNNKQYESVRKEFLDAGEDAVQSDTFARDF